MNESGRERQKPLRGPDALSGGAATKCVSTPLKGWCDGVSVSVSRGWEETRRSETAGLGETTRACEQLSKG